MSKKYIIDANIFIEPFQKFYSMDIAPTYWYFLEKEINSGNMILLEKVYDEVLKGGDKLSDWVKKFKSKVVSYKDSELMSEYANVINYLKASKDYKESCYIDWAEGNVADAWIVAVAKKNNYTVVTFEQELPVKPYKKAKIPNVCKDFAIEVVDLYRMMRELGFKFS